jgi:hypothetical protein
MLWDWVREALKPGLCCTCLHSKSLDRTGKSLAGDALSMANSTLTQPMRLKLFATVTILVTASIAAFAQVDEPDNEAPPTIEDVQKLVQTISGDKAKLKAYCELGNLYERVEKAEEKNDMKELGALGVKVDSLEKQVGPDYRRVMDGLGEVDPNSAEGQKLTAVFEPLHEQCK